MPNARNGSEYYDAILSGFESIRDLVVSAGYNGELESESETRILEILDGIPNPQ